jgi:hypothetical protein
VNAPAGGIPRDWRRDKACQAIAAMMMGFVGARKDLDSEELVLAYRAHLAELPVHAIAKACDDLAKRKVKDAPVDYLPSSARVFEVAEKRASAARIERHQIGRILSAKALPAPLSAEQQAEVRAKLETLARRMTADREAEIDERVQHRLAEHYNVNRRQILAEWDALGLEPLTQKDGTPISVQIARQLRPDYFGKADRKRRRA